MDQDFKLETDTTVNNTGEDYLSEDMLSYILKQFHSFIPEADFEDSILKNNPIPNNVPPPAPLDEFWRGVLEQNHKYLQMQKDKLLQKLQQKVLNVLDPLLKIW